MNKMSLLQQNRIKKFRELRNYTQEYMAEKLQISQNTYSNLEAGKSKLTIERAKEIADILEVPFWELVSEQPVFNVWNNEIGVGFNQSQAGKFYHPSIEVYESTISLLKDEIGQLREEKRQLMKLLEQVNFK